MDICRLGARAQSGLCFSASFIIGHICLHFSDFVDDIEISSLFSTLIILSSSLYARLQIHSKSDFLEFIWQETIVFAYVNALFFFTRLIHSV